MSKTKRAAKRIAAGNFTVPSPDDVTAAMSGHEAWTAKQLAEWGVEWPPPAGWRRQLRQKWQAQQALGTARTVPHQPADQSAAPLIQPPLL